MSLACNVPIHRMNDDQMAQVETSMMQLLTENTLQHAKRPAYNLPGTVLARHQHWCQLLCTSPS